MKIKVILIITLLFYPLHGFDINEEDKQKHLKMNILISTTLNQYLLHEKKETDLVQRVGSTYFYSFLIGFGKEVLDEQQRGNSFDEEDIYANLMGITIGVFVSEVFNNLMFDIEKDKIDIKYKLSF